MNKKESFYWDLVKGMTIFLMLWGHCIQYCALETLSVFEDIVFKTIYTFHMPVLMLVSGYLFYFSFQKRDLKELLEHRIRGMLHPIIMATFLNNILLLPLLYGLANRVDFLFGTLFGGIEWRLWFLWAVLYCSAAVAVCCKATSNLFRQIALLSIGVFAILLVPQWDMTLFMYPYFIAGFFCGMYRKQAKQLYRIVRYVVLVVFPVMVTFYRSKHLIYITPMYSKELGLWASLNIALFRWAIGFVGSVWMLSVMDFLLSAGERIPAVQTSLKAISHLGKNSLQIYCLSASLLTGYLPHLYRKFTEIAGGNIFAQNAAVYDFLFTPILAAAWSVFLYCVVALLKKCKLHKLFFGR